MNSLHDVLQDAHIIQYADDTMIYSGERKYFISDSKASQSNKWLVHLFELYHLTLNTNKNEVILF